MAVWAADDSRSLEEAGLEAAASATAVASAMAAASAMVAMAAMAAVAMAAVTLHSCVHRKGPRRWWHPRQWKNIASPRQDPQTELSRTH